MSRYFIPAISTFTLLLLAGCGDKEPAFDPGAVESVEARLYDSKGGQQAAEASTRDAGKIETLVAVLRRGKPTEDHKCGDSGRLILRRAGSGTLEFGILAGHDPRYYEFRVYRDEDSGYDMYRVERESFVKAMAVLGMGPLDKGMPE